MLAMAAYIDLNPVRAGMVGDPADYTYSGYGEAVAGVKLARRGLAIALSGIGVSTILLIFGEGNGSVRHAEEQKDRVRWGGLPRDGEGEPAW